MHTVDIIEALAIERALQAFHDELESIADTSARPGITRDDATSLQERLRLTKGAIKQAAKHGTLSGSRQEPTELERCFYGPAIRSASASFRLRVDANPKSSEWQRGIDDVQSELSYALHGLRKLIQEAQGT
ncbi:hypothetical protein EGT29_24645 [Pigmentiphaga sp. H8]|uniref:hypothetical protein n=1 Tax=Pigmentiphaga sp. H8 TaxID=2488560 RepID=UPI000F5AF558|nr:hypothetical protein [Pigmentiphaga sp. H8]AZG10818.1 hypothetical protein EGT29_24645 [Pigmentiphaga sp. H8]